MIHKCFKCDLTLKEKFQAIIAGYLIANICFLRNQVIYLLPAALTPPPALQIPPFSILSIWLR